MSRDLRIVNMSEGQKAESSKVFKRIGEIDYRNAGSLSKIIAYDYGKALITEGLRVASGGGLVVTIPTGKLLQRIPSGDIIPCISIDTQTVTLDAASGVSRTDIIECQITSVTNKNDTAPSVLDPTTGIISLENIKRDVKYYLDVQKKTGTTTATASTAAELEGTVAISGTIDLSENYLLNLADGEDGSFQEIDLRGTTPEATTAAEIVTAINTAVGRVMASVGGGNVIVLTGHGTGETSYFEIKPPVSDSDADALQTVFGVSDSGAYDYIYQGDNDWIKLAEIDMGASTTVITAGLIRNVDQKDTWSSDGDNIVLALPALQPISERSEQTTPDDDDLFPIETSTGEGLYIKWSTIRNFFYPVGDIYVQYPVAESDTETTAFPTAFRPATKFGGSWSELYDDENIFFRTKGTDYQTRTNGLSADQIQGHRHTARGGTGSAIQLQNNTPLCGLSSFSANVEGNVLDPSADGTNGTPRTGAVTEPRNRLFKVWIRTA